MQYINYVLRTYYVCIRDQVSLWSVFLLHFTFYWEIICIQKQFVLSGQFLSRDEEKMFGCDIDFQSTLNYQTLINIKGFLKEYNIHSV